MRVELVRAKTKFSSRGPAAPSSGAPSPILASRGSAGPHFSSGVKAHPDYPPSAVLKVWVGNEVFFDVRWRDAVSWPGWVGVAKCGSCLFYGFDGRAEVMSRVVPRVNFGKKRKEIGDEQVDFG